MTSYEISNLLYSDLRQKYEDDNLVFTQKYTVGRQCLDFLNKLQEKYAYCSQWTSFYFSQFPTPHNIVVYQFLSENKKEVRMHEHFCRLAISLKKNMCFQKEHDLAGEYFYHHMGENLGFTHNVSTNFFACYVSVKSGNISFNGDLETKKFNKLFEEYDLASES